MVRLFTISILFASLVSCATLKAEVCNQLDFFCESDAGSVEAPEIVE